MAVHEQIGTGKTPDTGLGIPINQNSTPAAKIALFRSLFRGREDVYPRRFESRKTGKAGYQPDCANEWVQGVCEKPRIKCSECLKQRFFTVTDAAIRQHLSGYDERGREFVMGIYPMLRDETCFFLAVDFDGDSWGEDTSEFLQVCRALGLEASLERSRSGNGGHVWFFFKEAIPALLARKLGSHLLTEAMEKRPEIGLESYDRLFPNQDTLPKGGFGNLIALPLQKRARLRGNTLFLDRDLKPYPDQWSYLDSLGKISRPQVEAIVGGAESKGRVIGVRHVLADEDDDSPWLAPASRRQTPSPLQIPLPEELDLVLADQIYVPKEALSPTLRNRLIRLAAFQNPEFYRAQAMRLPTYDKPRIIGCAEDHQMHIGLPRGCLDELLELLTANRIGFTLRDERFIGAPLKCAFTGTLRPEQQAAADALLAHDTGVLAATTAFGKTVVASWLIAMREVNALVLVHRGQLLEQWIERLSSFLGLPPKTIGRLGGGRRKLTGRIDVALIQSLVRKEVVDDRVGEYGFLIVDECHHLSARSFELVARRAKAKYVLGLSATVTRKDGHHPIVFMQCGPVRYRVQAKHQAALRPFTHEVIVRPTAFRAFVEFNSDRRIEFHRLYEALHNDAARNEMICADVIEAVRNGRTPLVLTERTDHLELLVNRLSKEIPNVITLRGGMGQKAIKSVCDRLASLQHGVGRVLLATGRYIGEGFDDARLDTLFLALPVSWRGTVAQYVGRLHRISDGKKEVRVYDYADLNIPVLARMFDRRCRGYEALGYTILVPASALPGWPADVPLPVDPEWKQAYAASIRRLVRDGVDTLLANLFVCATQTIPQGAIGVDRARSASEAFLYRRLQTLVETKDQFGLNIELPIPFDGMGKLEADFCCTEARLVVELDGAQHLDDASAYRRDRKKDALLQQYGYFVLRFLAEDIGQRLDQVLDEIIAALIHRKRDRRS